ncbi:MAG: hypothetical protein AAF610_11855 [Pseudomonadota bacterium]
MFTVVRMYDSGENAQAALQLLTDNGMGREQVTHFSPDSDDAAAALLRAVHQGLLPGRYSKTCLAALEAGHHVVAAQPLFGKAARATALMDRCHPVNTDRLVEYEYSNSGPVLSNMLGLRTLSRRKHIMTSGVSRGWTFSGTLGIKTLTKGATPLSSLLGLKTLTTPKSKSRSFGFPLLSRRGTVFGFNAIKREDPERFDSFGIPLISKEPTPLSSLLGLKVLSKDD